MAETIVEVRNLKQHFRINSHFTVKAVDGISFSIHKNEIFALVGESGYRKIHGSAFFDWGISANGWRNLFLWKRYYRQSKST